MKWIVLWCVMFTAILTTLDFIESHPANDKITIKVGTYNMMLEDVAELNELKLEKENE